MASHHDLANLIWQIADLLRGPYRPPEYGRVMLPMTVLRRFDCVLAPTKAKVIADYERRKGGKLNDDALDKLLNKAAGQRFHNHSLLTFEKPRIRFSDFGEMQLPLPGLPEQHAIVDQIGKQTAQLDALRSAARRTIALLKERRSALSAAAVTGTLARIIRQPRTLPGGGMRIDRLEVRNFKKFAEQTFTFHPQFTLLVGENGSGKTSVLDALSVALGVWLVQGHMPDSSLANSTRTIAASEKRLRLIRTGDRPLFQDAEGDVSVRAIGRVQEHEGIAWEQRIGAGKKKASNAAAKEALDIVDQAYSRARRAEHILLPIIAYYGAGRAWLPHNQRGRAKAKSNGSPANRWAAFYDCLNERIRLSDLADWFQAEAIARGNRGGSYRPGFEIVRKAVLRCVPDADDIWYDGERKEIVFSIAGESQPLSNLSAGQRMMLALVADIAIKAVTQNNYLVPPDALGPADEPLPRVLAQTPGVVLIDELDVHLHPRWQRQVASDLKQTFPSIQSVCTSHSPQVIGELTPQEIRILEDHRSGAVVRHRFQPNSRRSDGVAGARRFSGRSLTPIV
jgi:predicted ATP-binding protein involved in virulence